MRRILFGVLSFAIALMMIAWTWYRGPMRTGLRSSAGLVSATPAGAAEPTAAEQVAETEPNTAEPASETAATEPAATEKTNTEVAPETADTETAVKMTASAKPNDETSPGTTDGTPEAAADPSGTPEPTAEPSPTEAPEEPKLLISEILPTNTKYNKHNGGCYDAVEIFNASEAAVMLSGYCLSDSKKRLTEYPLPEVELAAGEYMVFYCTGKYDMKEGNDLAFKLSYFGEKVFLSDREGNVIDKVKYPQLPQNVSYGRDGEEWRIYDKPTLGSVNEGGLERVAETPEVDLAPGFYEGTQTVTFTTGGTIRYTLDGSKPDSSSKKWDGQPIEISETCTIRAYATEENCLASFDAAFDYFIDAPDYELDVLSLSLKESDFGTMNKNYNSKKKYAASITLFSGGQMQFSEDCAISVYGATSRAYPKKSYQITFSSAYGVSKLRYRVFDNLEIDEFNSLVLRSGSQDASGAMMRDEYVSSLATSYGVVDDVLVQAYKPVNIYINGQYWGIYYIREHIDEDMIASHYGCDPEEVTIIKQMNNVICGKDGQEWKDLWKYISNNRLKDAEAYEYVKSVADVQSVADYYIIQLWNGNIDMDNVRVCKAGDNRWIYILYDLDLTLYRGASGTTAEQLGTFNTGYYTFNALINRLLENEEFRELFCERLQKILNLPLSSDAALTQINQMEQMLDHDMKYSCERWQGVKDPHGEIGYRSYKSWKSNVETLRTRVDGREWKILKDFIKAKGIPDELVEKYFPILKS